MMVRTKVVIVPALLVAVLAGCDGGGGGKTYITQFPKWNFERYKRVAVLPMQVSQPQAREAAEAATYALLDSLSGNSAFTVLSRADLNVALTEQDLSRLADVADPSTALPEGKILAAQAMVIGKITEFKLDSERKDIRIPEYARDRKGRLIRDRQGRPRVVRENVIPVYTHRAVVGGNVRVLDTATAALLLNYVVPPIDVHEQRQGSPPQATPEELAVRAARELALDVYKHIAPVQMRVKLKSDMLIVALDYYEGKYDKTKEVPTTLDKFLLVLRDLPSECDRNTFRVTIAADEGREYLFEKELVWSGNRRAVTFDVPVSKLAATGAEKFIAKLFSGSNPEPILDRSFKLVPPEKSD